MSTQTAVVRQVHNNTFIGKAESNHWVAMDTSEASGGAGAATSPREFVLLALGGCTLIDVASILRKKRAPVTGLEVELRATLADEVPRVYTDIHVHYVVHGTGVKADDVARAIELSATTYCSVSAMLRPAVRLTHDFAIVE